MNIEVRNAKFNDIVLMCLVNTKTWLNNYKDILPNSVLKQRASTLYERIDRTEKDFIEHPNNIKTVALVEEKVVGMAYAGLSETSKYPNSGEIYNLYIDPDYQGKGIGEKLFLYTIGELRKQGFNDLVIKCISSNPSCNFYELYGGEKVDEIISNIYGTSVKENIYYYSDSSKVHNYHKNEPESLKRLLHRFPYLSGRHTGFPSVGKKFSESVSKIADGFSVYDKLIATRFDDSRREYNFTSGDPLDYKAFPPVVEALVNYLQSGKSFRYPYSEGDDVKRLEILSYLMQEGFININPYHFDDINENGLSKYNMTFTTGTSHAFQLIMDALCQKGDVFIVPGPNYGLFALRPERVGAKVEVLPLEKEDGYLPNPDKLDLLIKKINNELKEEYKDESYIPKVVGFLNANPNNPTGKVMGKKHYDLLKRLGEVCLDNGVMVIDDLVYRDICFSEKDKALPMASIPGLFKNTISLLGLSKSYGMAAIRSGLVVADEIVIREIVNRIFQEEDAVSIVCGEALGAAYNSTPERNLEYQKYFTVLRKEYLNHYLVFKALVKGINSIPFDKREEIKNIIKDNSDNNNYQELLDNGISGVDLIDGLEPEAGFFVLLNFNKLKGYTYNDKVISNEVDMLNYFYKAMKLRYILGSGCLWPNRDDILGRFTFAKSYNELINMLVLMNSSVKTLINNKDIDKVKIK